MSTRRRNIFLNNFIEREEMTLSDYFDYLEKHGQAELARQLGIDKMNVFQWRSGRRKIPAKYAAKIEEFTDGKVTRKDMFPDTWRQIWPELENKP